MQKSTDNSLVVVSSGSDETKSKVLHPTNSYGKHGRSYSHRFSGVRSLSRRNKQSVIPEFSNKHQVNKMVKELCHVISCFRQLNMGLGSSADSTQLRSRIASLRLLICHLVKVIRVTLVAHTEKWNLYRDHDKKEILRISNIYFSCISSFIQDLWRSIDLYTVFSATELNSGSLINTGINSHSGFISSESDQSQQEQESEAISSTILSCIKDMAGISAEVRYFPWHTQTIANTTTLAITDETEKEVEGDTTRFIQPSKRRCLPLMVICVLIVVISAVTIGLIFLYC